MEAWLETPLDNRDGNDVTSVLRRSGEFAALYRQVYNPSIKTVCFLE
jgi:hypothetical protein